MKLVWVAIGLALTLAGAGFVACGPEQKYCYQQHVTCAQAALDKQARDQEENDRRADAGLPPLQLGESETVVGDNEGN
jgi:hypothetical protein